MSIKIDVQPDGTIVLKEVYSGVLMETSEGNEIGICMRDDSFEINVIPKGSNKRNWWRVDMQNGTIIKEGTDYNENREKLNSPDGLHKTVVDTLLKSQMEYSSKRDKALNDLNLGETLVVEKPMPAAEVSAHTLKLREMDRRFREDPNVTIDGDERPDISDPFGGLEIPPNIGSMGGDPDSGD